MFQIIIHSFIVCRLSELHSGHGEPVPISGVIGHQGRIHPGRSANPSQGTHTLSFTHARQFRDANQPTMHVFGLGEETGVPGGNPRGTGRTCKLHTHGGGGNRTPNPGGEKQKVSAVGLWTVMAKTKELTEDLRLRIVAAHKSGKGYTTISKCFEVPVATVQSIIKKYNTFRTVRNSEDVVGSQK
ncbi:hypothetical protein QTP70_016406 [Hemibagrus guttatus]|uniref:Sleeping Beauty transposase HTH domain-containing protein n=1 Tax=Hemibagrus guttatus TaxID=175788 RepID=A0AAE0V8I7_9TELE|nr:hypothetical protein QTP70_016406 [Hemibagrus guttatus]